MPEDSEKDLQDVLKRIRSLEIKVRHVADEIFSGSYHSVFKGQGMNFEEVREYQPGDEIRSIDWNVTARLSAPHVKQFTEERQILVMILMDLSQSSQFGSSGPTKRELAAEVAATLAFSAIRQQDRVGLILFTDEVELYVPPGKGRPQVLKIIREVLYRKPKSKGTDVAKALEFMNRVIRKRSIAFVLSDFISPDFENSLSLVSRRHDLVAFPLSDPAEESLPSIGRVWVQDAETGEQRQINFSNPSVQASFKKKVKARKEELRLLCARNGVDHIPLQTDSDSLMILKEFFSSRDRKR